MKKRLAIILVLALLVSSLPGQPLFAGSNGKNESKPSVRASVSKPDTAMRAPSERESRAFREKATVVERVLPSRDGLDRINESRRQKGLPEYPSVFAAAAGEELVAKGGSAKTAQKYGAILSNYEILTEALPAAVDLSLSGYFPVIADQGDINACASFATTYYAATYETAAKRNIRLADNPGRILSPRFNYNLNNDGEDIGASLIGCLLTLYTRGVPFIDEPSMQAYQYNPADRLANGSVNPLQYRAYPTTAAIYRDALKNRVADVGVLTDVNLSESLDQIRQVLNNGHVLILGTSYVLGWQTDKPVGDDPATTADDPFSGQKACFDLVVPNPNATSMHALTAVGYNDDIWVDGNGNGTVDPGEKGALKLANSWGSEWMNGGYIWLSYQALKDADGQPGAVTDNEMYFIFAQDEYVPRATAEVTISTAHRNELTLLGGINWNEAAEPLNPYIDFVFRGSWGGPYSFAGTTTEGTATVVLDLTDAILEEGFAEAPGMLSFCAGVADDGPYYKQVVQNVTFQARRSFTPAGERSAYVQNQLKWFCGKSSLNGGDPPPYDATIEALLPMPLAADQLFHSTGMDDAVERLFTPVVSGNYTFSGKLANQTIGLEIQNATRHTLLSGLDTMTVMLYGGKSYVLRAAYLNLDDGTDPGTGGTGTGTGAGFDFVARIERYDSRTSDKSARLSGLSASSAIALQPAFKPDTLKYNLLADGDFSLTSVPEDSGAYVVSGGHEGLVHTVTAMPDAVVRTRIEVTSSDWLQTRTYLVYANYGTVSANAALSSLTASAGTLSPAFSPETTTYALDLPADNGSVTIGAAAAEPGATVAIDGIMQPNKRVTVAAGESALVTIQVMAPDQVTTRTYQVHVGRPGSFAPGTFTIPSGTYAPADVAVAPDRNTVYLLDRLANRVYAADLDTGRLRALTLPADPFKLAVADGDLLVALRTQTTGSDLVAVVDPATLSLTELIPTLIDIDGLAGDRNHMYVNNGDRIDARNRITGAWASRGGISGTKDMKVNPVNGNLYIIFNGVASFQVQDGQLIPIDTALVSGASLAYLTSLAIMPDGRNVLTSLGNVLTCGVDPASDLQPVAQIDRGSKLATSTQLGEVYILREHLIQVYDSASLAYRRTILSPGPVEHMLASARSLVLGQKNSAGDLVFTAVPMSATLQSLKLDGDAYSELQPLNPAISGGTIANAVESIAVEAQAAFADAIVTAPTGRVPLAVGDNVIPITVSNPATGESMAYRLTVTRRAADPAPVTRNGFTNLGFVPLDMARDPDRDVVYLTATGGKSLYRVDLATGAIVEKTFPLTAERLTLQNGKIYLTLLRSGRIYYDSRTQYGSGAFAIIDTASFLTERIVQTNVDPFDIEADEQGNVFLAPGTNQHSVLFSYSGSGQMLSDSHWIYTCNLLDRNPLTGKVYGISTGISPRDIYAYETDGGRVTASYDSPYHGDYNMNTVNRVAPDGSRIFNGSGNVFSSAPTQTGDMVYQGTLNAPFNAISFDQPNDRFYTAGGKTLREYRYSTRSPLRTLTSAQEFLALEPDGRDVVALQKTDADTITNVSVYSVRRYPLDAVAASITLDGQPLPGFDPLVHTYTINLSIDADSIDIAASAYDNLSSVTGDLGRQPLALDPNTYTVTVTSEDGSRSSTYTMSIRRIASNNADLSALNITAGTLTPAFDKDTQSYQVELGPDIGKTTITLVKYDPLAKVTINQSPVDSIQVSMTYNSYTTVQAVVTARDGVTKKNYTIRVSRQAVPVTGISISQSRAELVAGRTLTLNATIIPANAANPSVIWTSSASNVATVNGSGMVSAIARGTTVITARSVEGGFEARCTVNVFPNKIEANGMVVDRDFGTLRNISINTSVAQLKASLYNAAASVKVFDRSGGEYTGDSVATGMTVVLYENTIERDALKLSVLGDISGDGVIDINDILYIRAEVLYSYTLNVPQRQAAELSGDGVIDINDILYIRAHILGTYSIRTK